MNEEKMTVGALQQMKRDGRKIVGVVAWDYQIATIADQTGVEIVSVGDSVRRQPLGAIAARWKSRWRRCSIVCRSAVRRGVSRALVSVDIPFEPRPARATGDSAVRAAIKLVKEAGADLVKIDGAADFPAAVAAVTQAGIPVWAQLGVTPQTALRHGVGYEAMLAPGARVPEGMKDELVADAKRLEEAGAALLDFTNSGPVAGPEVTKAVGIPVIGGAGGGPWLDGRGPDGARRCIGYGRPRTLDDRGRTPTRRSRTSRWTR